jgi:hypothetical protein
MVCLFEKKVRFFLLLIVSFLSFSLSSFLFFSFFSSLLGCQELATILRASHAKVHSVRAEKSDSYDHLKALLPPLDPKRHDVGRKRRESQRKKERSERETHTRGIFRERR